MSNNIQLTSVEKLLIELCRLDHSEQESIKIGDLMKEIADWDEFVTRANDHGIIALCWYNISQTANKELIPERNLQQLYNGFLKSLARNTGIYRLLDEVLDIAEEHDIKLILLKGLALEKTIYGNRGLRQMNDLDILVKKEDAIKLRNLLLSEGFESMPMISPLHEKILPYYGKHLPEMYRNGLAVEIHFRLFDNKHENLTNKIIETAFPTEEKEFFIPETILHLLYLIKHLDYHEKHGYSQLRLYSDLINILQYIKKVELTELFRIAESGDLKNIVADKMFILDKFFSSGVSSEFKNPELTEKDFINNLRQKSFTQEDREPENILKPLQEFDNLNDKIFFLLGYLFPSISFMKYRYKLKNMTSAVLWYPIRWLSWISRWFR